MALVDANAILEMAEQDGLTAGLAAAWSPHGSCAKE